MSGLTSRGWLEGFTVDARSLDGRVKRDGQGAGIREGGIKKGDHKLEFGQDT